MSELPPTDLIYQVDAYQRDAHAIVVAVDNEMRLIALDRTNFYPGGGGQPPDIGYLTTPDSELRWNVQSTHKVGATVWPRLLGISELPSIGTELHGTINTAPSIGRIDTN